MLVTLYACARGIIDDFKKDEKLRTEFLKKCDNGELHEQDLNCQNVKKASNDNFDLNFN
ncbi:EexN family lipoprotein [Conservatibacter flavescens]|uniref:EexN family lipoprotein n=1 Tax=Conservatibacter flavescens TaxID=28161 RepID=UPI0013FD7572